MRFLVTLLLLFSLFHVQLLAQTSGCYVNYINPADGSKITSLNTATLVWQNIPGAASYELWFGTNGSYGLVATLPQGTNGITTYTVTNLQGSTTYQWYPVAKNAAGGYVQSCFPIRASFTTADNPVPPACTFYTEPQSGSVLTTQTTAQLRWASAPITTSYDIYLWTGDIAPTQPVATAAAGTFAYNATGLFAGTTYHWYVTPRNAAGPATNCIYTQVNFTTAYTIPVNDNCAGALEVIPGAANACGPTVVAITTGATASSVPACTGSAEDDIWFKFTPSSKRNKISVTTFAVMNPVIELFSGDCSSLTSMGCYTTTIVPYPTTQGLSRELPALVPGQTYYYRVYGSGENSVRTTIHTCIAGIPDAPSNDECSGALLLTANADTSTTYSYTGATGYASQSMISCVAPDYIASDVWFKFAATATSQKISIIPGTSYDYAFQVFGGTCDNLTPLACINNGSYGQPDATVLNNLIVGNTYYMRVWDYHGDGAPLVKFKIIINTTQIPSPPPTNGLQAVYYNGTTLSGTPLLTRVDTSINFELTYSKQPVVLSPAPGVVPEDGYSVRWRGKVQAQYSETYTFYTVADDGIRLWVNGQLLVDNWTNQGATEKSGNITLQAGQQYDIVIEYYENVGEAVAKLLWSSTSTPKQIVPKSQLFPSTVATAPPCTLNNLPANGAVTGNSNSALLSWNNVPEAEGYKVFVWQGNTVPTTPLTTVTTNNYTLTGLLPSTNYRWYIVPFNTAGDATGCSSNASNFTTAGTTTPAGTGTGLQGVYYNGTALSGTPLLTRTDATINFELTYSKQPVVLSPAPGIVPEDGYSVRWTGQVQPLYSETYTFYTLSDDGIRLWVNGVLLVDNWVNQGATEKSGSIALVGGQKYDIVVEYYESLGEAVTKLYWSSASTAKAIIPATQLYLPVISSNGTGLQGVYYPGTALTGTALLTRIDPVINFELTYSKQPVVLSPAPGIVPEDGYSVRWTGRVQPVFSETYTFYTLADDGIRLWVNGVLLVDNWVNQGATEKSGSIALLGGQQYDIIIEYYENAGEAVAQLYWSSASTPKQIVPSSQLYPPAAGARIMSSNLPVIAANLLPASPAVSAHLSPNPVRPGNLARLQISSNKAATGIISVSSSNGRMVSTEKVKLVAGLNTAMINTRGLAQGLYIITVTGGSKPINLKLLVE